MKKITFKNIEPDLEEAKWVIETPTIFDSNEWEPFWKSKLYHEIQSAKGARTQMLNAKTNSWGPNTLTRIRKWVPVKGSEESYRQGNVDL